MRLSSKKLFKNQKLKYKKEFNKNKVFIELLNELRDRKYPISSSGVSTRVLSHWSDVDILPEGTNQTGWRQVTLVELLWIECVQVMRDFGLSLDRISEVKDSVLSWDDKQDIYPVLEYFVLLAWISGQDPYIVFSKEGAGVGTASDIEMLKKTLGSQSLVLTSIKSSLTSVFIRLSGKDIGVVPPQTVYDSTSEDEMRVLAAIRDKDIESIQLKLNDGEVYEIESSRAMQDSLNTYEIERMFKEQEMYGNFLVQLEKGKKRSVKIVKRERLSATGKDQSD